MIKLTEELSNPNTEDMRQRYLKLYSGAINDVDRKSVV